MNVLAVHKEKVSGDIFHLEGWPVHVLYGPPRIIERVKYVSFAGDFGFRYGSFLPAREIVAEHVRRERALLSHFDWNIINFEFILPGTGGGFRERRREFEAYTKISKEAGFRNAKAEEKWSDPRYRWYRYLENLMIDALKGSGFHAVSLSNNHVNDYGPEGIRYNQLRLRAAGIPFFGTTDQPYYALHCDEGAGAIYAMTDLVDTDLVDADWLDGQLWEKLTVQFDTETLTRIRDERGSFDFTIAFAHLISTSVYPNSYQLRQIDALIEAGFSMIVCTGSHCVKGFYFRHGVPVFLGLGNHLFSYVDEFTENFGLRCVAGIQGGEIVQLFAIPLANDLRRGIVGTPDEEGNRLFSDAFSDRSSFNETKYFRDVRTLSEVKRSIRSYGFLPTKVSLSDLWRMDRAAGTYLYHMVRTVLNHYPAILRNTLRKLSTSTAHLLSLPFVLLGSLVYGLCRMIPPLRRRIL